LASLVKASTRAEKGGSTFKSAGHRAEKEEEEVRGDSGSLNTVGRHRGGRGVGTTESINEAAMEEGREVGSCRTKKDTLPGFSNYHT